MNLLGAWKKLFLFGLFGAVGCLAGAVIGELYLLGAQYVADSVGAGQGPSLISKPSSPSSEPPPAPRDFQERLEKAGAHTGDVQISLIWFNTNDLDLHCVDPRGIEISWQNRRSPSGGELDVDRNAGCRNPTESPVENIYWPKGGAPMGQYQVYLDYYQQCGLGTDESRYQVTVLHGSVRKEFSGTITKDNSGDRKKLIYEFKLTPLVEVITPSEFQLHSGAKLRVPVAIRRSFFQGKLNLKAENLPEGVTAAAASIEAGKNEGTIELKASDAAVTGKKTLIKIIATSSESPEVTGSADPQLEVLQPPFSWVQVIIIGFWTALLATGLCLALVMSQNRYLSRPLFASGRIPLPLVILGAVMAGFLSGSIGQSLFSLFLMIGVGSIGFLFGWILLGGLLGFGVSYFVPNLDRFKAMIAGLAGGLLGAIGYLVWSHAAELLGRFAGAALLGFCIGLMMAIVEAAFRRVWLEVRYGERETITVNLGPEPVKIGGDARACTVWARGAVDVALRYFVRDGRVICEDAPTRNESIVGNGDTRTVGTVTLIVHTGTAGSAARTIPRPLSTLPSAAPVPTGATNRTAPAPVPTAMPDEFQHDPLPQRVPSPRPTPLSPVSPPLEPKPVQKPTGAVPPKPPVPTIRAPAVPPISPPPTAKPPVPAAAGTAAKPPGSPPTSAKPPVPVAGQKRPPAPPPAATVAPPATVAESPKAKDPDACPSCGRKAAGRPGARFCMICDRTY